MKREFVKIGGEYGATVSGRAVRVRVLKETTTPRYVRDRASGRSSVVAAPAFLVENLNTGRKLRMTAARLTEFPRLYAADAVTRREAVEALLLRACVAVCCYGVQPPAVAPAALSL